MPYLAGRMDRAREMTPGTRNAIEAPPSSYLKLICYDVVCYRQEELAMCIEVGGAGKIMYGSDYPHDIGDMKGCHAREGNSPGVDSLTIGAPRCRKGRKGVGAWWIVEKLLLKPATAYGYPHLTMRALHDAPRHFEKKV